MAPAYISDLINVWKHARYSLRSLNSGTLLKSFGDRSFSVFCFIYSMFIQLLLFCFLVFWQYINVIFLWKY